MSGAKRRAPGWAQRYGLEWVHRAVTEPRRLIRRYARDLIVFAPRLARQVWATRPVRKTGAGAHEVVRAAGVATVRIGGPSRPLDEHEWRDRRDRASTEGDRIVVDLAGSDRLGGGDIATIVEIARIAARSGVVVELAHVGASTPSSARGRRDSDTCWISRFADTLTGRPDRMRRVAARTPGRTMGRCAYATAAHRVVITVTQE